MTKMPAMLDAQKQLDKLSTTYDADYKRVEEYQKLKKYEAEAATVTEAINGEL
jgi:outer membrane protein